MKTNLPEENHEIIEVSSNDTLNKIRQLMNERNWSVKRLSKESEIAYSSLHNLFVRNNEPKLSTLRGICKAFNISLSDFFSDEPTPDPVDITSEERNLLVDFRSMNRNEKKLLLAYVAGLTKKDSSQQ